MSASPPSSNVRTGVAWALAGAWMSAGFVVSWKLAAGRAEPEVLVVVLLAVAAIVSSAASVLRPGPKRRNADRTSILVACGLAVLTLTANLASASAVSHISGPLFAVVLRFEVIVVAVLAWQLLGERFDRIFVLGALIAAAGLWVVNAPMAGGLSGQPLGLLFGVATATSSAGMVVLTRMYAQRIDATWVNAARLWIALGLTLALCGRRLALDPIDHDALFYAALAAVFGPGLARLFFMYSARHVEARTTALVALTGPVWALPLCWLFLGAWPATSELLGGVVMLCGVALPLGLRHLAAGRGSRGLRSIDAR